MLIFPGQGSQFLGMGIDLLDDFKFLSEYFEVASDIAGFSIKQVIQDETLISKTEYSQILIFFHSAICLLVLEKEFAFSVENFSFAAGHSLGEYSALFCSKAISFEDSIKILKERGIAMMEAQKRQSSCGMLSILGEASIENIQKCIKSGSFSDDIFVANFNSENQIVLSGSALAIEEFQKNGVNFRINKTIKLPVSGAFHCKFMGLAEEIFSPYLDNLKINKPKIPIIMNFDAKPTDDENLIKKNLLKNITNQVKWQQSLSEARLNGINKFIQIGAKDVLIKMLKRSTVGNDCELIALFDKKSISEF